MNKKTIIIILLALVALASCSSDPQWADEEAHEKTEQLRKQYTPIIAGTWHVEYIKDKWRFFERQTFNEDGTFTGMRIWQTRQLVTVGGEDRYTDWLSYVVYRERCGDLHLFPVLYIDTFA